jgi:hypothetical protein
MGLAETAAAAAGAGDFGAAEEPPVLGVVDMGEYEPGEGDPEMIPVHLAWLRVRRDVRSIAKGEQYNGGGTRFNFRGVDTVVNTFGPVTLRHGINVFPVGVDATYRDTTAKGGGRMHECVARVTWQVMGPMGDVLPMLVTEGEALDAADKATAKAQSVALRVLLLTGGLTPTSDPDPDSSYIERGSEVRTAESFRDELLDPGTTYWRTDRIGREAHGAGLLERLVLDENGAPVTLNELGQRLLKERAPKGGAS